MKNYKYYPPEMEPNWKDWIFENWDMIGLITICIVTVLIGIWTTDLCKWIASMTTSYLHKMS